jgi:alpha-D-ribose 1-methylphosphonate 5-triphosphate synthase subunit PhnH
MRRPRNVRAIEATSDPGVLELLTHLKRLWMNLTNQKAILTSADMNTEIALTAGVHVEIIQLVGPELPRQHTEIVFGAQRLWHSQDALVGRPSGACAQAGRTTLNES